MTIQWFRLSLTLTVAASTIGPVAQATEGATCRLEDFEAFLATLAPVKNKVELEVRPNKAVWHTGDKVRITIRSSIPGRLVLMTVDAANRVFPMYPSSSTGTVSDIIRPGHPVTLPSSEDNYAFEAQPPYGSSRLIAIVRPISVEKLPLECVQQAWTQGTAAKLIHQRPANAPAKTLDPMASRSLDGSVGASFPGIDGWGFSEVRYIIKR